MALAETYLSYSASTQTLLYCCCCCFFVVVF